MRIVHVAPRLTGAAADFSTPVCELGRAQARQNSGRVQLAAAAAEATQARLQDLELRTFPAGFPAVFGASKELRHHLANCPLEIVHAHCPGERGLHYAHLAAQRHGAPLIVSPAHAFGLGAGDRLRLRCLFQRLCIHPHALEDTTGWHATSAEEAAAIHACGFRQPICIASPGITLPTAEALAAGRALWQQRFPALADRPVVLGTGPAHRLRHLIALWAEDFAAGWLLLIVTADSSHNGPLSALTRRHGVADRVFVAGADQPPPHGVARLYLGLGATESAFAPVAQALAMGLPALVTTPAPWSRLPSDGAGWCVPWRDFAPALRRALALGPEGLAERGAHAQSLARREFNWTHTAELLLAFYRHLRR